MAMLSVAIFCVPSRSLAAAEQDYKKQVEPLLKNYCYDCHGDGANKGDVSLDGSTNFTSHLGNRKLWLAVWQNLQTQMMPPAKKPQPTDAERRQITKWIERDVFKLDPENPEYLKTVRGVGYKFEASK